MPRNKLRLQLALYARPKHPGTYHYALFIAPKHIQDKALTTKHHVKNTFMNIAGEVTSPWRYERAIVTRPEDEQRLLVRVVVAKLTAPHEVIDEILESVPVYQVDDLDESHTRTFSCRTWVRDALQLLSDRKTISGFTSWVEVQQKSVEYVATKQRQRRWSSSWTGPPGVPLMDALGNNVELIP